MFTTKTDGNSLDMMQVVGRIYVSDDRAQNKEKLPLLWESGSKRRKTLMHAAWGFVFFRKEKSGSEIELHVAWSWRISGISKGGVV